MIRALDAKTLVDFLPAIGAMVDTENARGDNIDVKALASDLMAGRQFAVMAARDDSPGTPIIVLLCQDVADRVRPTRILYINNIWIPDREEFARYVLGDADLDAFSEVTKRYDRVLFQTDNWVLIKMLRAKGLAIDIIANVCEIRGVRLGEGGDDGRIDTV